MDHWSGPMDHDGVTVPKSAEKPFFGGRKRDDQLLQKGDSEETPEETGGRGGHTGGDRGGRGGDTGGDRGGDR
ncbi:hypothetical protein EBH_0082050 [Eimeria brunetti]|uniref:Uncharacterized protein n=1 Tax=Eimeria brunetti TaxID=51314 RepID=U6LIP8_9EIME|nr:hypothetical protein EBH_0082050 [Eimeria brunetti]